MVGYNVVYRSAWDLAVDPPLIPGVLFVNRKFEAENPGIEDLGPTAPAFMDGKDIRVTV